MTDDQLKGWKEIATFLGTSDRTAQRWEGELQLPVHRLSTRPGGGVFALRQELIAWRASQAGQVAARQAEAERDSRAQAPVQTGPHSVAAGLAESRSEIPATPVPSSAFRRHWRRLAAIALAVVAVTAILVATNATRTGSPPAPVPAPAAKSAPPGLIIVRLTWADGFSTRVAIPNPGTGRAKFGDQQLELTGRVADDTLVLEIGHVQPGTPPGSDTVLPIVVLHLRAGIPAAVDRPYPFVVEWIRPRQGGNAPSGVH